jgi:non-heme chloroperoxidase
MADDPLPIRNVNTWPSGRIYLGRSSSGAKLPLNRGLHKEHWVYSVSVFARHAPLIAPVLTYLYLAIPAAAALEWHDPSPHKQLFIETAPGCETGSPRLGWNRRFDIAACGAWRHCTRFRRLRTSSFHVFATTRRGFGASSQPSDGYDLSTLTLDIKRVLDGIGIERIDLVGHSIAGDELTRFAITFPDRLRKLVYLEAAYDRVEAQRLETKFPKIPRPPAQDVTAVTPGAIRASVARSEIRMPEGEIRATRIFGRDGRFIRSVTPDWIAHAVAVMLEHPNYAAVHAPILSIYAVYEKPPDLIRRYSIADEQTRSALKQVFALWQPFARTQRESFRKAVPAARVIEISGASHYVFISNPDVVLREMRTFLQSR